MVTRFKKHWFTFALLAVLALAVYRPELGQADGPLYPQLTRTLGILLIFFLTGLTLRTHEVRAGLASTRLHLFCQSYSFVVMPAVAILLRAWAPAFVPAELLQGIVVLAILPTTITSCVVFTAMARGNVTGAIFNSVTSNLAGVFLSPFLFSLLVADSVGVTFDWRQLVQILELIVAPLLVGLALRRPLGPVLARIGPYLSYVSAAALLLVVFFAFSSAFAANSVLWQWGNEQLLLPLAMLVGLHFFFLTGAWQLSKAAGLSEGDRRAALFVAPQKTVAMGLPLLYVFFAGKPELAGVIAIPLIFYHPIQLLVAGPLAAHIAQRKLGL